MKRFERYFFTFGISLGCLFIGVAGIWNLIVSIALMIITPIKGLNFLAFCESFTMTVCSLLLLMLITKGYKKALRNSEDEK